MVGDDIAVDTGHVGEDHIALGQGGKHVVLNPCHGGLHPAEFARLCKQLGSQGPVEPVRIRDVGFRFGQGCGVHHLALTSPGLDQVQFIGWDSRKYQKLHCTTTECNSSVTRLCRRSKPRKMALAAAMRKLLLILNAVGRD